MALTYNSLFLVTVVALISPILSVRVFRGLIPAVVIEILFGILVGPSGLHIVTSTKYVDFMANFGFSYLMFLSGLELDFGLIFEKTQTQRISPWVRAILFFLSTFAVSAGIAALLFALHWILHPFIVALVLSTTSTGILTPALKESAWIADVFGQELLAAGLVADMLTLMAITGYVAFHTSGNAFSILLVMVLLLMFVILYRLFRLFAHVRGLQTVENATSEMGLRWAFALILSFLAFSETLGTEVVVGAFLAGAIVSLLAERHSPLTQKLNSIGYGFLLPIFFVNVGLKFSVHSLAAETNFWLMLAVMLVGMYLNKTLPALVFMRRFPVQQRFAGGVLLSARLSLIIAASQIGSQIGVLTQASANGFVLLAITTCIVSPAWFGRLMRGIKPSVPPVQAIDSTVTLDSDTLPEGWVVAQIDIQSRRFNNIPMRNLRPPADILFVSIMRGDERIVPRGHTTLEQFDSVQVLGHPDSIQELRLMLGGISSGKT